MIIQVHPLPETLSDVSIRTEEQSKRPHDEGERQLSTKDDRVKTKSIQDLLYEVILLFSDIFTCLSKSLFS